MKKIILALVLLSGCSDAQSSYDALSKAGYIDIKITGWEPLACSDSDQFSTGFYAKNPQGEYVSGVVCCGLMKRCTIRF